MADENSDNNANCSIDNAGPSRKRPADTEAQICRDFLRNACTRGKACKYYHPEDVTPDSKLVEFCHDYQNRGRCRRTNCKYMHCTEEEEKIYHETGALPPGVQSGPAEQVPVCKDYLNGMCTRTHCKFRHVDDGRAIGAMGVGGGGGDVGVGGVGGVGVGVGIGGMLDKRRRLDYDSARMEYADRMRMLDDENMFLRRRLADREDEIVGLRRRLLTLEGETESLQRKLMADPQCLQLKKQVADLASMNGILLEQNARLKLSSSADTGNAPYGQGNNMSTAASVAGSVTQAQNYLDQLDQKYSYGQGGSAGHSSGGIRYM